MDSLNISPIGVISSCYKEKFGIPRQPGLVDVDKTEIILNNEFQEESIRGLQGFSHLWVIFVFHATQKQGWKPMVRPPRLGGNEKVGVFASRSTFRPNSMGMSVVKLKGIDTESSQVKINVSGCDLLDGTPVLDIKPYLPYSDSIPDALGGFAEESPEKSIEVTFTEKALSDCLNVSKRLGQDVRLLIQQILQLDPRPSYQRIDTERVYSMKLHDFDLKWQYCENNKIKVIGLLS